MGEKAYVSGVELYRAALSILTLGIAVYTGGETARIAPFAFGAVLLICLCLLILPGIRYVNLLFMQLSLLFIFCYDSFDTFIRFAWLAPLIFLSLGIHIWRLRPKLRIGPTFLPLVAVAMATVCGGLGLISAAEYFRPIALGYVFALGPGLVLVYLLMKNELPDRSSEGDWLRDLFWWGVTATATVFVFVFPPLIANEQLPLMQWSNNMSTILMITMPAVAARVRRYPFLFLLLPAIPMAMILTTSRSALLFAPVEFFGCMLWLFWREDRRRWRVFYAGAFAALVVVGLIWGLPFLREYMADAKDKYFNLGEREPRWRMLLRSFENFRDNPLFGTGLGYQGNADIYSGKTGTINWYHMFPSQVFGGLGIVGVLAWGYQLITRFLIAVQMKKRRTFVLAMCYAGLLLMSMINPGEFCPAPYAFLAVSFFALIENRAYGANARLWFVPRRGKREQPTQASDSCT